MRIAIAHDYLTQRGGAERVVLALTRIFPNAPIYTTLFEPSATFPEFKELDVRPSWLNRVPYFRRSHRSALPLLPLASSAVKIDADVVVASSSGWAHGFRATGAKLVYCYAPARWLYERDRYLGTSPSLLVSGSLSVLSPALRRWDQRMARTADKYLAISTVTQDRIQRAYGRAAPIVPAPANTLSNDIPPDVTRLPDPGYFLLVSRLLPYKNVAQVVEAFRARPEYRLLVVGDGPQRMQLRESAPGNVTFLRALSDAEMAGAYGGCSALVAASHEDFGLTPIEAATHGKPSVVLRWGGFLDTVRDETGVFFDAPTPSDISQALDAVLARSWDPAALRVAARAFDEQHFAQRIREQIRQLCSDT